MRLYELKIIFIVLLTMVVFPLPGWADLGKNEVTGSHENLGLPNIWGNAQQTLSILLLIFGIFILIPELVIIYRKSDGWNADSTRIVSITLIIVAGLFLIVAGYSDSQIAPVIGLLGTIVGYLLGKDG